MNEYKKRKQKADSWENKLIVEGYYCVYTVSKTVNTKPRWLKHDYYSTWLSIQKHYSLCITQVSRFPFSLRRNRRELSMVGTNLMYREVKPSICTQLSINVVKRKKQVFSNLFLMARFYGKICFCFIKIQHV